MESKDHLCQEPKTWGSHKDGYVTHRALGNSRSSHSTWASKLLIQKRKCMMKN
jgi:hypothetical protein